MGHGGGIICKYEQVLKCVGQGTQTTTVLRLRLNWCTMWAPLESKTVTLDGVDYSRYMSQGMPCTSVGMMSQIWYCSACGPHGLTGRRNSAPWLQKCSLWRPYYSLQMKWFIEVIRQEMMEGRCCELNQTGRCWRRTSAQKRFKLV